MSLLSKTRELNTLLQKHKGIAVDFKDVAQTISSVTVTNVFIVSRRGKILGSSLNELLKSERIINMLEERHIPSEYTEKLMDVKQTQSNIDIDNVLTVFPPENKDVFVNSRTTIFPILGGGERLGTLVLGRVQDDFNENDLVLGEYAATVIGMEILREKHNEVEKEARDKAAITMAINSLSYSEKEAIEHIFSFLGSNGVFGDRSEHRLQVIVSLKLLPFLNSSYWLFTSIINSYKDKCDDLHPLYLH